MLDGIISLSLSKKYTNEVGSGITSITVKDDKIHFVTTLGTEFDVTLPYSTHNHSNLNTVLEKFTTDVDGNLLFNGVSVGSGEVGEVTKVYVDTELSKKEDKIEIGENTQYYRGDKTWQTLNKETLDLGNVDNTSDLEKPISLLTQQSLDSKVSTTDINIELDKKVDKVEGKSLILDTDLTSLKNHKDSKSNPHTTSLSQLSDLNIVNLLEGQKLSYDSYSSKWINVTDTDTDEKIKATSESTESKYLNELIDNKTIEMTNDKLIVKSVDGVSSTELHSLVGMDSNIKEILTTLSNAGMSFKGVKDTKSELIALTNMKSGDLYIIKTDETQDNLKISYIYDGSVWLSLGESNVNVRDFTTNKIDLTLEVKNVLPKENMDLNGLATSSEMESKRDKTVLIGITDLTEGVKSSISMSNDEIVSARDGELNLNDRLTKDFSLKRDKTALIGVDDLTESVKNSISNSNDEIVSARNGETTLSIRLNKDFDTKRNKIDLIDMEDLTTEVNNNIFKSSDETISARGSYTNLSERLLTEFNTKRDKTVAIGVSDLSTEVKDNISKSNEEIISARDSELNLNDRLTRDFNTKRDKSTLIEVSDLSTEVKDNISKSNEEIIIARGTYDDLNSRIEGDLATKRDKTSLIAMDDLSQDVKTAMVGGESNIPVVGENSVDTVNIKDDSISSAKIKEMNITDDKTVGSYGTVVFDNSIKLSYEYKMIEGVNTFCIIAKMLRNVYVYINNQPIRVADEDEEVIYESPQNLTYSLYVNLNTNKLELRGIQYISVPHKLLCSTKKTTPNNALLYGNDSKISVFIDGLRVYDQLRHYGMAIVGNASYGLNIDIDLNNKTVTGSFRNNKNCYMWIGAKRVIATEIENCTWTGTSEAVCTAFYDESDNKIKIVENKGSNVLDFATADKGVYIICTFYTSNSQVNNINFLTKGVYINNVNANNLVTTIANVSSNEMPVDFNWTGWQEKDTLERYRFRQGGINPDTSRIWNVFEGSIQSNGMLVAHTGGNSRWNQSNSSGVWKDSYDYGNGGHLFEGFAKDYTHRFTTLIDSRDSDNMPVICLQDYDLSVGKFGWIRVGCDNYSETSYGVDGGWFFTDRMARACTPLILEPRPLATYLPTGFNLDENGDIILDEDDNPTYLPAVSIDGKAILQIDSADNKLKFHDATTNEWRNVVFEDELTDIKNRLAVLEQ